MDDGLNVINAQNGNPGGVVDRGVTTVILKRIMSEWEQLDAATSLQRMGEFAGEGQLRASAQTNVDWTKDYGLVDNAIRIGREASRRFESDRDLDLGGRRKGAGGGGQTVKNQQGQRPSTGQGKNAAPPPAVGPKG